MRSARLPRAEPPGARSKNRRVVVSEAEHELKLTPSHSGEAVRKLAGFRCSGRDAKTKKSIRQNQSSPTGPLYHVTTVRCNLGAKTVAIRTTQSSRGRFVISSCKKQVRPRAPETA